MRDAQLARPRHDAPPAKRPPESRARPSRSWTSLPRAFSAGQAPKLEVPQAKAKKSVRPPPSALPRAFGPAPQALARPSAPAQRKCSACGSASAKTTCPTCAKEGEQKLVVPAAREQPRRETPSDDPAERQADAIGARIGRDIAPLGAIGAGPVSPAVRRAAERHLGVELIGAELRADGAAERYATRLDALAVTEGASVSFGKGQLSSASSDGRALIGHELTHVAQQRAHGIGTAAQRKPAPDSASSSSSSAGGEPLSAGLVHRYSPLFGADLSGVTVDRSSSRVEETGADAIAQGRHVAFAPGMFRPGTPWGDKLVAHELAHVVQQQRGGETPQAHGLGDGQHEREADRAADRATRGQRVGPLRGARPGSAQFGVAEKAKELVADKVLALVRKVAPDIEPYIKNPSLLFDQIVDRAKGILDRLVSSAFSAIKSARETLTSVHKGITSFGAKLGKALKAAAKNDCEPLKELFKDAADAFSEFAEPLLAPLRAVFDKVRGAVKTAMKWLSENVFPLIKKAGGAVWAWIKKIGDKIGAAFRKVKALGGKFVTWIKDKLGLKGDGPGIMDWIKGKASALWEKIKPKLQPLVGPLKIAAGVFVATTIGPTLLVLKYGPKLVAKIRQLYGYLTSPQAMVDARNLLTQTIFPAALSLLEKAASAIGNAATWAATKLGEVSSALGNISGGAAAVPFLKALQKGLAKVAGLIKSGIDRVKSELPKFLQKAQQALRGAMQSLQPIFDALKKLVESVKNVLSMPGAVRRFWDLVPNCLKAPIATFVLKLMIAFVRAMPSAFTGAGPLGPILKESVIGFLQELQSKDENEKIDLTNRIADLMMQSPTFIAGSAVGLLQGIWDGIIGPFEMVGMLIEAAGKIADFLKSQVARMTPEQKAKVSALGTEAAGMPGSIKSAIKSAITEGGGGPMKMVTAIWDAVKGAAQAVGSAVANAFIKYIKKSDYELGKDVGFVAGMVLFEVGLAILTAGGTAALSAIKGPLGMVLKAIVKVNQALDKVFEPIFGIIGTVGRGIKRLFSAFAGNAGIQKLGSKVGKLFGKLEELVMSFTSRHGDDASRRAAAGAAERDAKSRAAKAADTPADTLKDGGKVEAPPKKPATADEAPTPKADEKPVTELGDEAKDLAPGKTKPEPKAKQEQRPEASKHKENQELTQKDIDAELQKIADNPKMIEGTPPKRTAKVGEHEWVEQAPGGRWCRTSSPTKQVCAIGDLDATGGKKAAPESKPETSAAPETDPKKLEDKAIETAEPAAKGNRYKAEELDKVDLAAMKPPGDEKHWADYEAYFEKRRSQIQAGKSKDPPLKWEDYKKFREEVGADLARGTKYEQQATPGLLKELDEAGALAEKQTWATKPGAKPGDKPELVRPDIVSVDKKEYQRWLEQGRPPPPPSANVSSLKSRKFNEDNVAALVRQDLNEMVDKYAQFSMKRTEGSMGKLANTSLTTKKYTLIYDSTSELLPPELIPRIQKIVQAYGRKTGITVTVRFYP